MRRILVDELPELHHRNKEFVLVVDLSEKSLSAINVMLHTVCRCPLRFDTLISDLTWRENFCWGYHSEIQTKIDVKFVHLELRLGDINT